EKDYEAQQKEIKRLTEWIEKWKNTPTKVATAHSKEKVIEHMVKIEKPRRFDRRTFHAHFSPRIESWNDVLNVKALDIGYTSVLSTVNFKLTKGQRIAIIGENGRGKSTLLKTIVGLIPSLGGTFNIGNNVEWGYFDQQLALNSEYIPTQTVLDNFWDAYPKLNREEARSALGAFVFSGEEVEKQMGQLSGGERVRLALCKMFYSRPNLLILDEPTNHMDMLGKESLEEMLLSYQGTVLVVSHDRYFIDRVATGILDFEGGSTRFYPVPYKEYIEIRKKEAEGNADSQPMQKKAGSKPGNVSQAPSGTVKNSGNGMDGAAANASARPAGNAAANASASDASNIGNNPSDSAVNASAPKKLSNNPGKERARLERKIAKLEKDIAESEAKAADIKAQMEDPEVASSYSRLMELQAGLEAEETIQENLLNEMM
ncbi:MAG: ABC-F family ATP-binding cassette domain-containing protein, partial [Parasporobacterium sp.]|nr:ABC-F family ATP-binding cassette domain-containing protein [Parasporobacterium sp.]